MNMLWALVLISHLGAKPQFIEVVETKELCIALQAKIENSTCVPVIVGSKYTLKEQVETLNELLK